MTKPRALFIGHSYIDVTFLTDHIPTGDEKYVAQDYAVSFGGNAVTAAFCCAKLSAEVDLITTHADDWLGRMFMEMAEHYSLTIHPRLVETSSLSFVMPNHGKRRCISTVTSPMPLFTTQRRAARRASSRRWTEAASGATPSRS
jgi:sugar/nucleoside kinase (ribokinase family)